MTRSLNLAPMAIRRSHSRDSEVGSLCAVHSQPCPCVEVRFVRRKRPFPSGNRIPEPGSCAPSSATSSECVGNARSAAHKDKRPLCLLMIISAACIHIFLTDSIRARARSVHGSFGSYSAYCCRHVLGDVHKNRSRTAASRDVEGSADRIRKLLSHLLR